MKRVKYVSRFTRPMTYQAIDNLVSTSSKHNKENGITGVLLTSGGIFFQIIEGPEENIDALLSKITADRRHTDVILLAEENNVDRRLFSDWSLGKMDLDSGAYIRNDAMMGLLDAIVGLQKIMESLANSLGMAAWNELTGAK